MAEIKLIRLDFRLVHGQVITKWSKQVNANRIVVINDELANDSFMKSVYEMAAPPDVSVEIYDTKKAVELWEADEMGKGRILALFKDVKSLLKAFKAGFPIKELQIGGLGGGQGRVNVYNAISFNKEDVEDLKEMAKAGTEIILHVVPEEPKLEFEEAVKKFES